MHDLYYFLLCGKREKAGLKVSMLLQGTGLAAVKSRYNLGMSPPPQKSPSLRLKICKPWG
jgi:hypothetical protein